MATNQDSGGGGGERVEDRAGDRPADEARANGISSRWLKTTQLTNRLAFEREMERHRQQFDSELQRFWRTHHSTT